MYVSKRINQSKQEEPQFPSLNALLAGISNNHGIFPIVSDGADVLSIHFDEMGNPVRKVLGRSNYRQTHQIFSKKTQKAMSCESLIEFKGCYILETIPEIKSYQMQPAVISYTICGETHRHVPDALVEFIDGTSCFIEFKPESELGDEDLITRTELLRINLPAHGYGYLVVCDDQVSGIPLINAKLLFHSQITEIPQAILMDIKNLFDSKSNITIGELLSTYADITHIKNYLYQLMRTGTIGYDIEKLITSDSDIYWKGAVR
ncbi:MAG: TnsA endonuclease N-terminal domain-containing protein [Methylotenera sp.]